MNLRDIERFMDCLKAARAYRFIHGSSPALWDCTFQFYSKTYTLTQEHPHQRLSNRFPSGQNWGYAASPSLRAAIRCSFTLNGPHTPDITDPDREIEPPVSDKVNHARWTRTQARVEAADAFRDLHHDIAEARRQHPIRLISLEELQHLRWSLGPLTLANFMFHKFPTLTLE